MVTLVLVVIAVLIVAWLLGLGNVLHVSAHVTHQRTVLLIALVVVIFALVMSRR